MVYVTDVERRIEIARQVQAYFESNPTGPANPLVGWSVLMTAPLDQIQDEEGKSPGEKAAALVRPVMFELSILLRICKYAMQHVASFAIHSNLEVARSPYQTPVARAPSRC